MRDKNKILTANEASEILRSVGLPMTPQTLRLGLEEHEFPFGWCIIDDNFNVAQCFISKKRLMAWMEENGLGDDNGNIKENG